MAAAMKYGGAESPCYFSPAIFVGRVPDRDDLGIIIEARIDYNLIWNARGDKGTDTRKPPKIGVSYMRGKGGGTRRMRIPKWPLGPKNSELDQIGPLENPPGILNWTPV